jgi:hypothetical protein
MNINPRSHERRNIVPVLSILLAPFLIPSPVAAQDPWPSVDIRGGALVADFLSDVRVDGSVGNLGTSVDLEDDLGFASHASSVFVDGVWRISRRNQLHVEYEGARRDVSKATPTKSFTWGDTTFSANAQVDSFLDTFYISGDYAFAFLANPTVEFGASIGLTFIKIHAGIGLSAQGSGGTSVSRDLRETSELTVPVPLPGVFFNARPHPRVTITGSARVIKASIGDYTASLIEAKGGAEVMLARPLGVGGSYYFNRAIIERKASRTNARVDYRFNGPQIYAVLSF